MAKTFHWCEGAPNPIRTPAGSVAKVRHAVPLQGSASLCGARASYGWQSTSMTLPSCDRCAKIIVAADNADAEKPDARYPLDAAARRETTVRVALCVNDARNGAPTYRVREVHVYTDDRDLFGAIEIESSYIADDDGAKCYPAFFHYDQLNPERIRVGHCLFDIAAHRSWVGNWCWDSVLLSRADAKRLIRYLTEMRGWMITSAPVTCDFLPAEAPHAR